MSIERSFEGENRRFDVVHYLMLRLQIRDALGVANGKQSEHDCIEGELDVWKRISVKGRQQSIS